MMDHSLLSQFLISTLLVVFCVVVHGMGLFGLSALLRTEAAVERLQAIHPLSPRGALFTLAVVLSIIALHGVEIWAFAFTYVGIGAVPTLNDAIYFSTISYSTVGYSDVHITPEWRLLGAFESMLGMILIGWSTSFFFRMLGRIDAH